MKPKVVVSKCIEFEKVRWDAQKIPSDFVKKLMPHVEFIPVCPEVEIGLGVPRHPIRIVQLDGKLRLIQPATNLDVTEKMLNFIDSFLDSLPEVDGFILKNRSPTSAIKDAKVYSSIKRGSAIISRGPGFFGRETLRRFPHLAIEDEGRLRNPRIREHFLTKLFTIASFRVMKAVGSLKEIIEFHTDNKFLLKAYSQKELRSLGRIVANEEQKPFANLIRDYQEHLSEALKRPPRCGSTINLMINTMGYFSKLLSKEEKAFFLKSLEKYRNGRLPLSVVTGILKSWGVRFGEEYLMKQTFFEPYPEELMDIEATTVYCDGKDYWG